MQLLDMGEGAGVAKLREVEGGVGRGATMAATDTQKSAFRSGSLSNYYKITVPNAQVCVYLTIHITKLENLDVCTACDL
jgi:hypothetical protein